MPIFSCRGDLHEGSSVVRTHPGASYFEFIGTFIEQLIASDPKLWAALHLLTQRKGSHSGYDFQLSLRLADAALVGSA
jgi:hypothetical protein